MSENKSNLAEKMERMTDEEIIFMSDQAIENYKVVLAELQNRLDKNAAERVKFNMEMAKFLNGRNASKPAEKPKPDYEKMWKELKIRLIERDDIRDHPVFSGWMKDLERIEESNAGVQSKK